MKRVEKENKNLCIYLADSTNVSNESSKTETTVQ